MRGDDDAVALAADAAEAHADVVLGDAGGVPLVQGALRFRVDVCERAGEAEVERLPALLGLGDEVPGEVAADGRGAFGDEKQLKAIAAGAAAFSYSCSRATLKRFVINDRKLANLQAVVQGDGVPLRWAGWGGPEGRSRFVLGRSRPKPRAKL